MTKMIIFLLLMILSSVGMIICFKVAPKLRTRILHLEMVGPQASAKCHNLLSTGGFLNDDDDSDNLCIFSDPYLTSYALISFIMYLVGLVVTVVLMAWSKKIFAALMVKQQDVFCPVINIAMGALYGCLLCFAFGKGVVENMLFMGFIFMLKGMLEFGVERNNSWLNSECDFKVNVYQSKLLGGSGGESVSSKKEHGGGVRRYLGFRDVTYPFVWIFTSIFIIIVLSYMFGSRISNTDDSHVIPGVVYAFSVAYEVLYLLVTLGYYVANSFNNMRSTKKCHVSFVRVLLMACAYVFIPCFVAFYSYRKKFSYVM